MQQKLIYITLECKPLGRVIEHDSSGYFIKRYHKDFGVYSDELCNKLSRKQEVEVFSEPTLARRVKKLSSFLGDAEFISDSVINYLNRDSEDIVLALANLVRFPIYLEIL